MRLRPTAYHAYRAASAIGRGLPLPVGRVVAAKTGLLLGRRMHGRRRMISRHLVRICGPDLSGAALEAAADRAFVSYARYWLDAFRLIDKTPFEVEAGMTYSGLDHVETARAQGRGVVLAMPHLGAWDYGGAWLAHSGFDLTVVAEPLEPPELFDWFVALRQGFGLKVVPLGPDAGPALLRTLRSGGVLGLVTDRDIGGGGVEVEFFGERTTVPGGPATLALRTGAPLLTCAVFFDGDTHRGVINPPLDTARRGHLRDDVERITTAMVRDFEALIRQAPEQWHVFQPNWPSDTDDRLR